MRNVHRFLFLFALNNIVQCEVQDWSNTDQSGNIWSNSGNTGQNGNIWSSSGNSGQNIWSSSEQNGDAWKNLGNSEQTEDNWSSSGNSGQTGNIWSSSGNSEHTGNIGSNSGNNGQSGNIWSNSGNNEQSGNMWSNSANNGKTGNIWSSLANNGQNGNIWSNSGNNGQNGNIWSSSANNGQNGNMWSNSENNGKTGNIWSSSANNGQNGNMWSNSGNNGQNGNIWSSSANNGQNGNIWNNSGNKRQKGNNDLPLYNYASNYQDKNVNFGYKVQNGNADVWFSSLLDRTPRDNNYKMTGIQQPNNNGWNQVQSSWNNQQGSEPQPYFYPRPPQAFSTPEPNIPTTTEQPDSAPVPPQGNGNYYIPKTNFYQNQIELSNNIQSALQQMPVIDLNQAQNSVPQSEPFVMMNIQENLPQKEYNTLPVNVQSISDTNVQPNLVQLPMQQQLVQYSQILSKPESLVQQNSIASAQISNFNNQQNQVSGHIQQLVPGHYLQNVQIPGNYPMAPQNPSLNNFPNVNVNQDQFNIRANIQPNLISSLVELLPPFNSNKQKGNSQNFPVLNAPSLITAPNFPVKSQVTLNSANLVTPEKREAPLTSLNSGNIQILSSPPLINVPASQIYSQQPVFDHISSVQSKFPVISQSNFPQPQQLQFKNSFMSQPNTAQQQLNIPVHPGYNYRPNGNSWINMNSIDADIGSKKVKRSYEVYEEGTDIDHNKINRMWFNGHGYPTRTGERRYVIIYNKNKDQRKNITEDLETTTQTEMVSNVSLNNSEEVKQEISNNIDTDISKIVDLK